MTPTLRKIVATFLMSVSAVGSTQVSPSPTADGITRKQWEAEQRARLSVADYDGRPSPLEILSF